MHKLLLITISFFIYQHVSAQLSTKAILDSLDRALSQRSIYNQQREERINSKKDLLYQSEDSTMSYLLCTKVIEDYRPYNSDSALFYSSKGIGLALKTGNNKYIVDAQINLSLAYTQLGMYAESKLLLDSINVNSLSNSQLSNYYIAQINLNRYRNIFLPKSNLQPDFRKIREQYQDSLIAVINKNRPEYHVAKADRYYDMKKFEEMRDEMISSLSKLRQADRAYGYTAYTLASAYGNLGDTDNQIKYLALSAISDAVNGQRENASLRELALLLYKFSDINRAYKYIKVALDDAIFSNAKLRSFEVMQILPLIEQEYVEVKNRMNRNMKIFGWTLSLLVLVLVISIRFIWRQKAKLVNLLQDNENMNKQLNEVNEMLKMSNDKVLLNNEKLEKLSLYQENYIAHYLKLSSGYIGKMDDYRKSVLRIANNESRETIIKALKSKEIIDKELKAFYNDFDKSFLDLYPNFVESFNELLKSEEQIFLKPDELLNSELRIFALIRLGITESAQIAEFLRYSVTTIYNYRTKMRNNSKLSREEFKKAVMRI